MGRPEVRRALASIAAQAYRPLEVVLVDAAGRGFTQASLGDIPIRVVGGTALDRPRAANVGIDSAHGEWLLFLDEDDEISPTHVASLTATAMVAGTRVAYSQAQLIAPDGKPGRILGGPFDRRALLQSNYLVSNAVLFHREVVRAGCRFDESMPLLEDWDFWLQASSRFDFAFTGQPTARYHAGSGSSGAGGGANLDRDALLAQRARILAKWSGP